MSTSITLSDGSLRYAAVSDVGMRRPVNQDSFATCVATPAEWARQGHLFIVADGMGAHAAGELASQQAVEEIATRCQASQGDALETLDHAMRQTNASIHRRGQDDPHLFSMGTTCSTLSIRPGGAFIGHVGDSRIYRCRDQKLEQLTFDHSLYWEMREARHLPMNEERASNIPRNVITRCLGPHANVQVDLEGPFSVRLGDKFLLCSDGLTGRVADAEIGGILASLDVGRAAHFLVDLANLRGGSDNITVLAIEILGRQLNSQGPTVDERATKPTSSARTHTGWWWIGLGVATLTAVMAMLSQQYAASAVAILVCMVAALGAIRARVNKPPVVVTGPPSRKPPYAIATAVADRALLEELAATLRGSVKHCSLSPEQKDRYYQSIDDMLRQGSSASGAFSNQCASIASELLAVTRGARSGELQDRDQRTGS